MTIRPGEFWVADIPFTNGMASKKRPVRVLWIDGNAVVVAVVTSAAARSVRDVVLADWASSGLKVPSVVRLSHLDCLEHSRLIARIGAVSPADGDRVKQAWARHIRPRF